MPRTLAETGSNGASLLESHEARIQQLGEAYDSMATKLLPMVARIDENLDAMSRDIGELKQDMSEMKASSTEHIIKQAVMETEVKALKDAWTERVKSLKKGIGWVAGIVAAVIVAAILARLGLT